MESLPGRKGDEDSPQDGVVARPSLQRAEGCWGAGWGPRIARWAGGGKSPDPGRLWAPVGKGL